MTDGDELRNATKRCELARAHFDYVEAAYFEGRATEAALRDASNELQAAQAALGAVHMRLRKESWLARA